MEWIPATIIRILPHGTVILWSETRGRAWPHYPQWPDSGQKYNVDEEVVIKLDEDERVATAIMER